MQYVKYTDKKTGAILWRVSGYLGTDPITGKQKNLNKRGFASKKEAQRYELEQLKKLELGDYTPQRGNRLFSEVFAEWFELHRLSIKDSTQNYMLSIFRLYILPTFGDKRIDRITVPYIQQVANKWAVQYVNYSQFITHLFQVFNYAYRMDYIAKNPRDKFVKPRKKRTFSDDANKNYYTKEELQHFLTVLEQHGTNQWYTFFRLLAFSGIRKGEAIVLTWNDISFKNKTITISKTLARGLNNKPMVDTPKTETSNRIITLDDRTMQALKRWKVEQAKTLLAFGHNATNKGQLVFCNLKKNKILFEHSPQAYYKKFCRRHGLRIIKIHGFRHTHATIALESGVPIKTLQDRLGHSDIKTTMNTYAHITEVSRVNAVQLLATYADF